MLENASRLFKSVFPGDALKDMKGDNVEPKRRGVDHCHRMYFRDVSSRGQLNFSECRCETSVSFEGRQHHCGVHFRCSDASSHHNAYF